MKMGAAALPGHAQAYPALPCPGCSLEDRAALVGVEEVAAEEVLAGGRVQQQLVHVAEDDLVERGVGWGWWGAAAGKPGRGGVDVTGPGAMPHPHTGVGYAKLLLLLLLPS